MDVNSLAEFGGNSQTFRGALSPKINETIEKTR